MKCHICMRLVLETGICKQCAIKIKGREIADFKISFRTTIHLLKDKLHRRNMQIKDLKRKLEVQKEDTKNFWKSSEKYKWMLNDLTDENKVCGLLDDAESNFELHCNPTKIYAKAIVSYIEEILKSN